MLSCLPMAIIRLFFPRIRRRKVRQWGTLNSKLWAELSTLALLPVTASAEACRRPQRSATVPSGHLPVDLGKFSCTPAMAWLEYHREIKSSHKHLVQIKKYTWGKEWEQTLEWQQKTKIYFYWLSTGVKIAWETSSKFVRPPQIWLHMHTLSTLLPRPPFIKALTINNRKTDKMPGKKRTACMNVYVYVWYIHALNVQF